MDGTMAVESIYTFGQPAVAEPAFTSELERRLGNRYFRFVHSVDSIPGLHVDIALKHGGQQVFIDRGGRIHVEESTVLMASERLVVAALTSDNRNIEVEDHGIAEYLRVLTAPVLASTAKWSRLENRHHYVSAALYTLLFVTLCVLTWTAPTGAQSFAMGTGAGLLLVTLGLMFFCRQPFNDYLLNWYRSHKLV
jgi:lipase (class 3)